MSIVHEPNLFALHGGLYQLYPLYLFLRRQLSGRKVLELDCGSGQGASLLAGGLAEEVIGVDRDAGAIEAASASHHSPLLGFRLLEQEDELPFHEASFDAVLALRRPFDPFRQPLIREITRVLTPAGLLVAALPNPALAGLPVPGTMAALDSAPITAHQLRLELRRTFTEVQLVAQSPLLGFFFHELALTDAAQRHVALDSSLVEGRLEEPYGWLAVCSRAGSLGLQATLVRLSFDDLVAVLREEAEQELERAGRILGEEARLQGYQEKLVAIHEQARWSDESATAAAGAEPSAANPAAATAASRPPDSAPAGGTPPAAGEPGFSPARLAELEQAARERDELAARLASCEQQLAAGEEQRRTLPRQLEVAGARQQQEENARLATDHDRTCAELEEAQCQLAALKTQLIATGCELQAALAERRFLAAEGQAEQQAILARLASLEALAARVPQLEQQLAEQGQANGDREQELHEAQRQLTEQELRTRQLQQLLEKEEEAARQLQQNLMVQQSAMQQLQQRLRQEEVDRQELQLQLEGRRRRSEQLEQSERQAELRGVKLQLAQLQEELAMRSQQAEQTMLQLAQWEASARELQIRLDEREEEAERAVRRLQEQERIARRLQQQVDERTEAQQQLAQQLTESDEALQQLAQQLGVREEEAQQLSHALEQERADAEELGQQLGELAQSLRRSEDVVEELQLRLEGSERKLAEREQALERLTPQLAESEETRRQLAQQLAECDEALQQLAQQLAERAETMQLQLHDIERLTEQLGDQQQLREQLEVEDRHHQQQEAERDDLVRQLTQKLGEREGAARRLEQRLVEREAVVRSLEEELKEHVSIVEALEERLATRESQLDQMEARLAERDGLVEELRQSAQRAAAELSALSVQAAAARELQRKLGEQEAIAGELMQRARQAEDELRAMRYRLEGLSAPPEEAVLERLVSEKELLLEGQQRAQREIAELKERLEEERSLRQELVDEMERGLSDRVVEIRHLEEAIAVEKDTSSALERHSTSVELLARRQREEISSLKNVMEEDRSKIAMAQNTVSRLIKVVKARDRKIAVLDERLATVTSALQEARAQLVRLREQHDPKAPGRPGEQRLQELELLRSNCGRLEESLAILEQDNARLSDELDVRRAVQEASSRAGVIEELLQHVHEERRLREQTAIALSERLGQLEDSLGGSRTRIEQVVGWLDSAFDQVNRLTQMLE